MKKIFKLKQKIIILLAIIVSLSFCFGQNVPTIKTPQTYNIEKFGNIPVSLNTGSISYDIDLFNYENIYNGNSYNIGLKYYGTGFVPAKKSNYVGLDWSLDIGGTISREVRGLPDDFFSDWPKSQGLYGHLEGAKTSNKTNNDIYNFNYPMLMGGSGGIGIKTGTYSFEIEPDKFNFNFMGNSGYFFIGNDMRPIIVSDNKNLKIDISQLSSKQPLNPQSTNGSACLTKPTTILITDEKGIKYYFGGNYENLEISYNLLPQQSSENRFTITAWNLYKIEYPNSNVLEIKYRAVNIVGSDRNFCIDRDNISFNTQEPFLLMFDHNMIFKQEISSTNGNYNTSSGNLLYDGTIYWGNSTSYSNGSTTTYSATKKSLPSSITLNGKNLVTFDFERFEKYLQFQTIPSLKLKNIIFYDITGNNVVKEVNLNYYRYKDYFFLDKIKMFRKEPQLQDFLQEYSFDYYNKDTLPDENTGLIDYWGYFNNKPRMNMIPNFTLNKNTGDYIVTDNTREADPTLCSTALLKTITYPTKGKSEFIYEPHKYSEKLDRNSSSQFKNTLIQAEGIVGGGRINKIINYSNDGFQTGIKEYKYITNYSPNGNNIKSSGILSSYYRNLIYLKTQTQFSVYEELNAYSDNIIETSMNSSPILYSEVTEMESGKGYTKYYFTDYKMYPDIPDYKSIDNNLNNFDVNYSPANMGNINLPYRSNNYKRGKLYKQEIYDQNFNKIKSANTEFIDISEAISNNFTTYVADRLRTKYFFKLFGGSFSPSKTITDDILNNNVLSSKSEYFYQSANGLNLSRLRNTDTDGTIQESSYQYAHEKNNQTLINANMVGIPLQTEIKKNGKIISNTETKYDKLYPLQLYPGSIISYSLDNNNPEAEVTFDQYDSSGNLVQYTTKQGIPVTLVWGYNNTQLIAKIEGIDYAHAYSTVLVTAIAKANLDIDEASEQVLITALNNLRSNTLYKDCLITTYTYNPSIGVTSITPPSGIREVYIYDTANRLKEIRQDSKTGNLVKEFKYNYKN
ncbi:hypothetical protein [Chryseobacterium paridis]|uniref:YD repeat-containing protein n=1 Tax=Chryseobacterium paridis TaxID=2800328 RepID=A0ABS1FUG7_9FLAO|nr:hypothetical protein [Chryseobacterium paridis]MBK1896062.1 hypothetical protein [Chryseobacterium paridis]